ncbi:hypothetical protein K431DRAFT_279737 [Polychaeton citri CBS 116435]|uniref:Zn(2)-C6 fungal-type domain-containing protein n=1 Tax=Polychaeton citri CBS 116435 TaxID=1314669 RepID=A0A9P4Q0X3_9PEZI|nr:hypothetical protein K431DRAFT_279737 [Polychaeton citri CBS 116435]
MSQHRVCDACSVRRVKCNGQDPCSRCVTSSLECRRLRPRQKMGPKGIRKNTLDRVAAASKQRQWQKHHIIEPEFRQFENNPSAIVSNPEQQDTYQAAGYIATELLGLYLDIYHHKMFPVWPVVDTASLMRRLKDVQPDIEAYMLALSVCTATILQLQLVVDGSGMPTPQAIVDEIEGLRYANRYRQHPTRDSVSTSFFLHISYMHLGQRMISTLLLREATSMAHLLNLHHPIHYASLSHDETQAHLRIIWLLFITERAHASQHDLPCIVNISPSLPQLDNTSQDFTLSAFTSLCNMFAYFDNAYSGHEHTATSLVLVENQLLMVPTLSQQHNGIQRADLFVTRQWMRLLLWRMAVSNISMNTAPSGSLDSMLFPIRIARDLISTMSQIPTDAFEAHGPGMELKLFAFASSLADVITCLPMHSTVNSEFGPRECLLHLARVLGRFRGGNEALMPILQSRLADVGLDVPAIPRLIEVSHDSNDSDYTNTNDSDYTNSSLDGINTSSQGAKNDQLLQ